MWNTRQLGPAVTTTSSNNTERSAMRSPYHLASLSVPLRWEHPASSLQTFCARAGTGLWRRQEQSAYVDCGPIYAEILRLVFGCWICARDRWPILHSSLDKNSRDSGLRYTDPGTLSHSATPFAWTILQQRSSLTTS